MRSRMATSTSPLSLSLVTGMEMAFVTRWVGLQKPVDLFHAVKKWVYEPKTASIFHPGIFPVFILGGWKIRPVRGGVAVVEPRPAEPELEILARFLMFFSTLNVSSGLLPRDVQVV